MTYINKKPISSKQPRQCNSNKSAKYYNDKRWKILRHSYIMEHPICADCAIEGRSVAADDVHHKIPFLTGNTEEERYNLLLDEDNLVSLCKECHLKRHGKGKKKDSV